MDAVEKLMQQIKKDPQVKSCRYFTNSFLNAVADVFLKHGFGSTKLFLMEKQNRADLRYQATALLSVLNIMENYDVVNLNRGIGRHILKTLVEIKKMED